MTISRQYRYRYP